MVANRHTVLVLLKHNIRSGSATHMQKLSTTDDVVQKSRLSLPQKYFISIITVTVVFPSNERASLQSTLHGPRTCQDSVFAHYYAPLQCSLPNLGCYLYLRTGLVHIIDNIGSTLKIVVQTHERSTNWPSTSSECQLHTIVASSLLSRYMGSLSPTSLCPDSRASITQPHSRTST